MDCLLANYASSDEEEHEEQHQRKPPPMVELAEGKKPCGIFNSLPPPKSSFFHSLPCPKPRQQDEQHIDDQSVGKSKTNASSSSLFSSLPPPKTSSTISSTSRKVVQFRPPTLLNKHSARDNDEYENEDECEKEKQKRRSKDSYSSASAIQFLSSMPAPKDSATLGSFPSALGAGRRSMIQTNASTSTDNVDGSETVLNSKAFENQSQEMAHDYCNESLGSRSYGADQGETFSSATMYRNRENDNVIGTSAGSTEVEFDKFNNCTSNSSARNVSVDPEVVDYTYYYANYVGSLGDYMDVTQCDINWSTTATDSVIPEVSRVVENTLQVAGKRRRKDDPEQIVEVKQDELMKNRPREDQTKMTGIAFGPAYQPASTKGKPSKLHKRKHQIGALYFDMRQKEAEFAERRSKGYVTKAQTQAKYGW